MRVLLIEDDEEIAETIQQGLERSHYAVERANTGTLGVEMAQTSTFSLIILDIMLPEMTGWEVCSKLRAEGNLTPILMLTARDMPHERVLGLDLGADDYLVKPFDFPEFLARIRSLLRRNAQHRTRIIRVGDLVVDTGTRRVSRGQREIHLTEREYTLLEALAQHQGNPLTREYIQEHIWHEDNNFPNSVDAYISLLRKKIDAGQQSKLIQTIYGVGYSLRAS